MRFQGRSAYACQLQFPRHPAAAGKKGKKRKGMEGSGTDGVQGRPLPAAVVNEVPPGCGKRSSRENARVRLTSHCVLCAVATLFTASAAQSSAQDLPESVLLIALRNWHSLWWWCSKARSGGGSVKRRKRVCGCPMARSLAYAARIWLRVRTLCRAVRERTACVMFVLQLSKAERESV